MLGRDIIITSLQPWDIEIGSNSKNIAREFSRNNRVLYVNPPADRFSMMRGMSRGSKTPVRGKGPVRISDNLWVHYPSRNIESISRLPVNRLFDILNRRNNLIFAGEIRFAINRLKFSNHIHFCDSDIFRSFYLKELLVPAQYIYYTRDNLLAVDYWKIQGRRIEPLHMAKADMVVANSSYLARLASAHNRNTHFIGQGCDLSSFSPEGVKGVPPDIDRLPGPVIGYIGSLNSLRLDIDVIAHIAASRPEWSIVLVGPEDESFSKSSLHGIANIYFAGKKDEKELPAYLNAFDVAINPQVINEVTIGNYPRKIDEYLAMGKPVVATGTEAMEYFGQHVSLANNKTGWIELIEKELNSDNPHARESRMKFAAEHTWERNIGEIYRLIKNNKTFISDESDDQTSLCEVANNNHHTRRLDITCK